MKKTIILALLLSSPLSAIANQGVNANPNFNQMQNNEPPHQYQNQGMGNNFSSLDNEHSMNSRGGEEPQDSNPAASKPVQQNDTIFDIKTTHGSIMIKKLPEKPKATAVRTTADTQKISNLKQSQIQTDTNSKP